MAADSNPVQLSFVLERLSRRHGTPDDVIGGHLLVFLRVSVEIKKVAIYFEGEHCDQ